MLVDGTLHFDANILNQRNHGRKDQEQCDRVGLRIFLRCINIGDKVVPKENHAGSDQPQHNELDAAHPGKQVRELLVHCRFAGGCNSVDTRRENRGNGRGELGKH